MEALNWMDTDLVETPRDSPALQQAPAPDGKHYVFTFISDKTHKCIYIHN